MFIGFEITVSIQKTFNDFNKMSLLWISLK